MALGITSNLDFEAELARLTNRTVVLKPVIKTPEGRGENIPVEIKKLAAEASLSGENQYHVAEVLNITQPTVSASAHGYVGTNDNKRRDEVLTKHVNHVRDKISRKASNRLIKALDAITEDKLEELGPVAASTVARNMSAIVREMEPEDENDRNRNNQPVIIIAPRERDIAEFEVVKALE